MYRMSLMVLTMPRDAASNINIDHCLKMCLIHDIGESIIGDITPHDNVDEQHKQKIEENAVRKLADLVHDDKVAHMIVQLWMEYEMQETDNARFVKDLDRLDMLVQANEYEADHDQLDLGQFFDSTEGKFQNEFVKAVDKAVRMDRDERREGK